MFQFKPYRSRSVEEWPPVTFFGVHMTLGRRIVHVFDFSIGYAKSRSTKERT